MAAAAIGAVLFIGVVGRDDLTARFPATVATLAFGAVLLGVSCLVLAAWAALARAPSVLRLLAAIGVVPLGPAFTALVLLQGTAWAPIVRIAVDAAVLSTFVVSLWAITHLVGRFLVVTARWAYKWRRGRGLDEDIDAWFEHRSLPELYAVLLVIVGVTGLYAASFVPLLKDTDHAWGAVAIVAIRRVAALADAIAVGLIPTAAALWIQGSHREAAKPEHPVEVSGSSEPRRIAVAGAVGALVGAAALHWVRRQWTRRSA